MSITHMSLVLNHYQGPTSLKLTLLLLADHAGENGECYPSYQMLAARLCCTERTAIRNVKQLIADGYVEYAAKGGRVFDKNQGCWINATNLFRVKESALKTLPNIREELKQRRRKLSTASCGIRAHHVTPSTDRDVTPITHEGTDTDVTRNVIRTSISNRQACGKVENLVSELSERLAIPND